MKAKKREKVKIASLLHAGKEQAISTKELVKLSKCSSVRELRERVAIERNNGVIICSGPSGGYWLPADRKEIEDFSRLMEMRASQIFSAAKSAREALSAIDGQIDLNDFEGGPEYGKKSQANI